MNLNAAFFDGYRCKLVPSVVAGRKVPGVTKTELMKQFERGAHCDVEIILQDGSSIYAHKIILTTACDFFKAAFKPDSVMRESKYGVLKLPADPPGAVRCLIRHIYTRYYWEEETVKDRDQALQRLIANAESYITSAKYLHRESQEAAMDWLRNFLDSHTECGVMQWTAQDLLDAGNAIYKLTDGDVGHGLRSLIIHIGCVLKKRLLYGAENADNARLMLESNEDFLLDILCERFVWTRHVKGPDWKWLEEAERLRPKC